MENTYITENPYLTITEHENHMYTLDSDMFITKGYCKKIDNNRSEFRLDFSFHKPTETYRNKRSKLFQSDAQWFCYMVEQYAHNFGQ